MHFFRLSPIYLASAALVAAQATDTHPGPLHRDEPVQLNDMIVTGSPYARQQTEIAQPTSVLSGQALLHRQSNSLGELLAGEPGISSTYFGPGASRPIIRGLGGDRIRMLENGVGTVDASVISPDHAVALDPILIERVEVVRGPAMLLYGGNAVGGVVNVIDHRIHTTRPDSPFNARIEARASSGNDEQSGGAVLEGSAGTFAWHLDGYRRAAGNVEIPGFAESADRRAAEAAEAFEHGEEPPEEVRGYIPNTSLTADGGAFGFSFIGDPGFIGFSYSGHNTLYGVPAGAHEHHGHDDHAEENDEESAEPGAVRIALHQRRFDVQAALIRPIGVFNTVNLKFGAARYRHAELEGDEIGTVFRNRGYDGRIELLHDPIQAFTGAIGWQSSRSDFSAVGEEAFLPPTLTQTNALFIFEEGDFKPITWQLGARVERQTTDVTDSSSSNHDETLLSASTGLVWTLTDSWTLGASLSRAERAPNAQELFADGAHIGTNTYEIGNPALDSEKSLAVDITLRKQLGWMTGSLTVFANRFDGYIHEQPTGLVAVQHDDHFHFHPPDDEEAEGGLPVYEYVQRDAQFHGAELETIFHLHHSADQQVDVFVATDFVRARNRTDRNDLPRITPDRVKTGATWSNGRLTLGGEVQFVFRQNRVAEYETPSASYALVSADMSYRFTFDRAVFDLFLRGTNLTNDEARAHTSFLKDVAPLPGRSLTLGLRAVF
jgi:iron complex outermembrane receptor protein